MTKIEPSRPAAGRRRLGALVVVINGLLYLSAEAIAAAAWRNPAYSYAYNYISDLGVPDVDRFQGRVIDSPLHVVMNTGFVLHGVLFIVAALLLRGVFAASRTRWAIIILAALHGIGIALVGLFHGSQQATEDGTVALHGLGALLAILAGNALFIIAGAALLRSGALHGNGRRSPLGGAFIALGIAGIASFVYLLATAGSDVDGIPERIAVDTIIASELLAGAVLLMTGRRRSTAQAVPGR